MAVNREVVEREGDAVRKLCEEAARLYARIHWLLEHNSDLSIDWGGGQAISAVPEAADGNLDTRPYSRQQIANAIGSLHAIRTLLTGGSPPLGDHLGNLNVLSRPLQEG